MSYVVFSFRKQLLISDVSDLQKQMTDLCYQQQNLSSAASIFATGSIARSDFGELNAGAQGIAEGAMSYMAAGGGIQSADQNRINFTDRAIQALNDQVYRKEKEIELKRNRLETQLKAKTNELESVKQAEDAAIKASTPKYTS